MPRACPRCGRLLGTAGFRTINREKFPLYFADCPRCQAPVVPLIDEQDRRLLEMKWMEEQAAETGTP